MNSSRNIYPQSHTPEPSRLAPRWRRLRVHFSCFNSVLPTALYAERCFRPQKRLLLSYPPPFIHLFVYNLCGEVFCWSFALLFEPVFDVATFQSGLITRSITRELMSVGLSIHEWTRLDQGPVSQLFTSLSTTVQSGFANALVLCRVNPPGAASLSDKAELLLRNGHRCGTPLIIHESNERAALVD